MLEDTVLVFDLDDTLYKEVEYQKSGIRYLGVLIEELTGMPIGKKLWEFYCENSQADFLAFILEITGWPTSTKESLLWAYRLHSPNISLDNNTVKFLTAMRTSCHALAILTDGRIATQTAKLKALKLDWMPAFISEAWESPKPENVRFLEIQRRWPNKSFAYVGDNPEKDFVAPNGLGWLTIGLQGSEQNVHSQTSINVLDSKTYLPQHWVSELSEIPDILSKGSTD